MKDALYKKSVPPRTELLQRAGKFLGKEIGGGALFQRGPSPTPHPLNVSTGGEAARQGFRWVENALEEVTVPMKTENPFRVFCGAVGLGSVYVKEARSRTVFYRCLLGEPRSGKSIGFSVYERTTRSYKL